MMEPTVKDGARDHLVAEDLVPGAEALLTGDDALAPFVAARHELKEPVGSLPAD
jgi:hypothetical protein